MKNLAPADQRRIDGEKWILRRRADEQDQSRFHIGQQNVLLGAVEAMNFIEKQHGALSAGAQAFLGCIENGPNFLHANRRGVHFPNWLLV